MFKRLSPATGPDTAAAASAAWPMGAHRGPIGWAARAAMATIATALWMTPPAQAQVQAQVSVGINLPGLSIGINVPSYPTLVRVPGYPVYWDPQGAGNYFFHDGLYWVFSGDTWYQSGWYNGPWRSVGVYEVPVYLLRVPVRYYRQPPPYFRNWRAEAPPRWGEHWGPAWQQSRAGWDRWDRRTAPAPAPLPVYQREYRGDRYPQAPQQQEAIRREREPDRDRGRDRGDDRERDRPDDRTASRAERPDRREAPPEVRARENPGQGRGREDRGDGAGHNGNGHGKGKRHDDDRR